MTRVWLGSKTNWRLISTIQQSGQFVSHQVQHNLLHIYITHDVISIVQALDYSVFFFFVQRVS